MGGTWKSTEETRRRILDSAGQVFARAGYHGTSVRDVSRDAGLRLPSIYHHFENKENLYRAVLLRNHEELYEFVRSRLDTGGDLHREVHSLFEALNEFHRRRPDAVYLIFSMVFTAPATIQAEYAGRAGKEFFGLLRSAFARRGLQRQRERLGLLNDLLRSFLLGLAVPAMRAGKPINKRKLIDLALGSIL